MDYIFNKNLRNELNYQSITVKELSIRTGIPVASLDCYLGACATVPSVDAAVKIARVLGVSVEYLVTGEEKQTNEHSFGSKIRSLIQNFKLLNEEDQKMIISIVQLYKNRKNQQLYSKKGFDG